MQLKTLKFSTTDRPEFVLELRKRVGQYFKENKIAKQANLNMKLKTAFMILLYFVPLILMLSGVVSSLWPIMAMWVLMSFGMAGIGLSIMHDANHGSYSKNKKVNDILGFLVNFLGAYHLNWKIQHNVLHHSFTNVDGLDDDISNPVMRFSPQQERKWIFRFQAYYAPLFYGIMTLYWVISKDISDMLKYDKQNLLKLEGLTLKKGLTQVIFNKIWYLALTLVIPMIVLPIAWWQVLLGFLLMHFICGLILALIFQPAHVIQETDFFAQTESGTMENNWAVHQLMTTANFANRSRIFSWLIGGLNFQIEHHLFPNICHVHYKKISSIVKKTAEDYGIPYYEHRTFFSAIKSHFSLLNQLGTGSYDKKLKAA